MKCLLGLVLILVVGCQTVEPVNRAPSAESQDQELKRLKKEIIKEVSVTIRNEILPELREVQIGTKRAFSKKQNQLKKNIASKILIGRVEWIKLQSPNIPLRARIDTGAQTCSMHAEKITEKTIDGERYVEFSTLDEQGRPHQLVKKIVEETRVKSTSGVSETRYVVEMEIEFGERDLKVAVNLNDRKNLRHRFLVGRNLLLGDYIVDVSQSRVLGKKP